MSKDFKTHKTSQDQSILETLLIKHTVTIPHGSIHKLRKKARGRGASQMPMLLHKLIL